MHCLLGLHSPSKRAKAAVAVVVRGQSIKLHLISSYSKQQLANPSRHGLNRIQHLWPWFTTPLHTFHATVLLSTTHIPSPLPEHSSITLQWGSLVLKLTYLGSKMLFNAVWRLNIVERSMVLKATSNVLLSLQCGHKTFSTVNGNSPPQEHWVTPTIHTAKERLSEGWDAAFKDISRYLAL